MRSSVSVPIVYSLLLPNSSSARAAEGGGMILFLRRVRRVVDILLILTVSRMPSFSIVTASGWTLSILYGLPFFSLLFFNMLLVFVDVAGAFLPKLTTSFFGNVTNRFTCLSKLVLYLCRARGAVVLAHVRTSSTCSSYAFGNFSADTNCLLVRRRGIVVIAQSMLWAFTSELYKMVLFLSSRAFKRCVHTLAAVQMYSGCHGACRCNNKVGRKRFYYTTRFVSSVAVWKEGHRSLFGN